MINSITGLRRLFNRCLIDHEEHEKAEAILKEAENQFRSVVEETLVGIYLIKDGVLSYVNPKLAEIFGYSLEAMLGADIMNFIFPDDRKIVEEVVRKRINGEIIKQQYEFTGVKKDGNLIHLEVLGNRVEYNGKPAVMGTLVDITDKKNSEKQLRMAHKVFENTIEGIAVTDLKGNIQWVNPAFSTITGYSADEALGQNPRILKSHHHEKEFYTNMWQSIMEKGQWQGEIWNRKKSGETYPEWLTISALKDGYGKPVQYVSVFNDITERIKQEEHIKYQSHHDALTGLPNRFLFKDRLGSAIAHAHRHAEKFAVLFLGLDRFKRINDTLGHAMGDKLLKAVAVRLSDSIQEDDTVARFSGDAFAVIIKEIKTVEKLILSINLLLDALKKPFFIDGHELYITASMGISLYPTDGDDADTLIKNADTAMYRAKELERNSYQLYTPTMNEKALTRLSMENDLHKALQQNELILYYQPQVDVNTGRIIGAEALVRWLHPRLGFLPPGEFIPLAEETGLIVPLGEWVLQRACIQNKEWQRKGLPKINIGVNLSTLQFRQKNLIQRVEEILELSELSPEFLELEITESIAMLDADFTNKMLHQLKDMGIQISIDDFGTGYSSLAYLTRFPIDRIKIDQSFIRGIPDEKEELAIVMAMMAMAKSLGLKTIAEGVEKVEQYNFLKEQYCHQIQGYYFSRPVDEETFEKMLMKEYI